MMTDLRLNGRKVLVTGAGGGLGRAIADGLTELGAVVYGTSRSPETAEHLAAQYGTAPLILDITDTSSLPAFVDTAHRASGGIDLLVNNAGINIPRRAVDVTVEDWDSIMDANLKGSFFLSTAMARSWLDQGVRGSMVNIASQAGLVAIEERAAYGASKAGLIHLTKLLALEWAPEGIRVNAVAPTFVRTELTRSTLDRPDWVAELLSRIPLGRLGEPEDVTGAVAFLLSEAAALITGQTLAIDGGYTIH